MDRLIEIKVSGNHLWKDNDLAGVQGEGNITFLRITFDGGWAGFAKSITFFDARGKNPVKRVLTTDLMEDGRKAPWFTAFPSPRSRWRWLAGAPLSSRDIWTRCGSGQWRLP